MSFRKLALAGVSAVAIAVGGASSADAAVTTALYLSMDASGSISTANFTTQISGYVSALNTFFANNPTAYGEVAIGGNIFGANVAEFMPLTVIASSTELNALTTAISSLDPGRGGINTGATAIGDAVTAATTKLMAFESSLGIDLKLLIDVTTDGSNNLGLSPVTAANNATTAGVNAVNCLGIGSSASCSWVGSNGTDFGIVNFANLGTALATKIHTEVIGVPEPMSLALFGMGLAGLGLIGRRRAD